MYDFKETGREGDLLKFSCMPEMRSKGRARKLAKTGEEMATDEEMYDADQPSSPEKHRAQSPGSNNHPQNNDTPMEEQPPVYIPEDVILPPEFELRESRIVEAGLGVFSLVAIPMGEKFGPFVGEERCTARDTQYAWEIVDDTGKVKCWIDASEPGTGNWMKYVRSAPIIDEQNMIAVQVDKQVFYKVIRPIQAGEELMVLKEAAFPDQEGLPFQLIEEQQYDCLDCREIFRSKVALRRHQKYACNNSTVSYGNMNQQIHNGCNNNTTPGAPLMPVTDTNQNDTADGNSDGGMDDSFNFSGSERAETPPPDETDMNEEDYSENRQFKCTKCPRSFNWKSNLLRHLSDHENDRYFPCENCDKSFSDPSNLQRHIRTQHVGARSHACPECGKTFATSSGLKQHTHIHSSIKPFTCEVCLKSYTQFSNLCRHKRMHADCRTQLKCTTCGQMFATITSLNKHRRFCHGSSQMMNGQVAPPILPIQQGLRTNGPMIGSAGTPSATSPNLMGMGVLTPTSSALHPANLAQLYNLQLTQQAALLQNNLLAYSGDKNAPAHPYLMGYPHLAAQAPLLATGLANGNGLLKPTVSPNNSVTTEDWLKHYTSSKSPNKNEDYEQNTPESEKLKKKLESDLSDGSDIDNVSTPTGSDLDSTSGSDLDSENEDNEKSLKKKEKSLKNGTAIVNDDKVEKAFLPSENCPSEPIKAIANIADKYFGGTLPPGIIAPGIVPPRIIPAQTNGVPLHKIKEEHPPRSQDGPFDLSKKIDSIKSPQVSPVAKNTRDEPLDLSMPSKKRESEDDVKKEADVDSQKVPTFVSSAEHERALQQQFSLTYAKPIPFSMDPIYRVGNGFPLMPHKFMRMDYASQEMMLQQAHAAAAFAGIRKFEHYDPRKLSPILPDKPTASPPQRGSFTVNSLLYANSADKMVIRSKDRYTCKFCGKLFPRSANLTRHLRTHTGEQPYSCKYCDRSFSISSNLQRHVRNIHNKEKPFKCPLCERCFGQQTNLDRHLKKHENERNEGAGSLSPITPVKDDLATKLKEAKLNGSTPLPPTANLNLEEKDESYFDEIKNFITDGNSGRVNKELLPDIRKVQPVLPRQVQSPSVGSSSPDGPKKDDLDSVADLKQLPKLEEMDVARHSPSPKPLEVDEDKGQSDRDSTPPPPPPDVTQDAVMADVVLRKRTSPSPLPSPPPSPDKNDINSQDHNGVDDSDSQEPINKRPRLRNEIAALKSFCPSPPAEVSEVLDGRENLTRHSKMQAYSLMMAQYDEDHHDRRRQQLHAHHPPAHTATAV